MTRPDRPVPAHRDTPREAAAAAGIIAACIVAGVALAVAVPVLWVADRIHDLRHTRRRAARPDGPPAWHRPPPGRPAAGIPAPRTAREESTR